MKKFLLSFFCVMLILSTLSFADEDDFEELSWEELEEINQVSADVTNEPQISSRHAIVVDKNSGKILYAKNENKRCAMASTTNVISYQR